jgi:hypothetical protein
MPLEKSPVAVTMVTGIELKTLDSVTAFIGEPSVLANCAVHRYTFAWTLPPSPRPKQKKVTVAGFPPSSGEGMLSSALRIADVGVTQDHPSGLGKENDPTLKRMGDGTTGSMLSPKQGTCPPASKSESREQEKSLL